MLLYRLCLSRSSRLRCRGQEVNSCVSLAFCARYFPCYAEGHGHSGARPRRVKLVTLPSTVAWMVVVALLFRSGYFATTSHFRHNKLRSQYLHVGIGFVATKVAPRLDHYSHVAVTYRTFGSVSAPIHFSLACDITATNKILQV